MMQQKEVTGNMRNVNTLWCVVERNDENNASVFAEEVFYSRREARDYLRKVKGEWSDNSFSPRSLFIRQLRVTNKRG